MGYYDEMDKTENAKAETAADERHEKLAKDAEDKLRKDVQTRYNDAKQLLAKPSKFLAAEACFQPTFYEVLPVLPVKKALVFVTSDQSYALCYKKSEDVVNVYATSNELIQNVPQEMAFSAAHTARGNGKTAKINVYGGIDIHKNVHPLFIIALKLLSLINDQDPSDHYFNIPDITEMNYDSLVQVNIR
uniref:Uncharacterized protein n=1 Tax=Panagrolaimus sp. ES5 TaxID=591445 RepID=A0AC34G105_9BILA